MNRKFCAVGIAIGILSLAVFSGVIKALPVNPTLQMVSFPEHPLFRPAEDQASIDEWVRARGKPLRFPLRFPTMYVEFEREARSSSGDVMRSIHSYAQRADGSAYQSNGGIENKKRVEIVFDTPNRAITTYDRQLGNKFTKVLASREFLTQLLKREYDAADGCGNKLKGRTVLGRDTFLGYEVIKSELKSGDRKSLYYSAPMLGCYVVYAETTWENGAKTIDRALRIDLAASEDLFAVPRAALEALPSKLIHERYAANYPAAKEVPSCIRNFAKHQDDRYVKMRHALRSDNR